MYNGGPERFHEKTKSTLFEGRLGHSITLNANPIMTIYPLDAYRNYIEFPVFV